MHVRQKTVCDVFRFQKIILIHNAVNRHGSERTNINAGCSYNFV